MCRCEPVPTDLAFPTSNNVSYPQDPVYPSDYARVACRLYPSESSAPGERTSHKGQDHNVRTLHSSRTSVLLATHQGEGIIVVVRGGGLTYSSQTCWWSAAISEIAIILAHRLPAFSFLSSTMPAAFLIRNDSAGVELTLQSTIGMVFIISAGLLRLYCYRTLGRFFTFEVSIRKGHQLVTAGPYSIVRHPSYTAIVLMTTGMILWFMSGGAWLMESGVLGTLPGSTVAFVLMASALGVAASLCRRVPLEDELLKNQFPQEWENWARRVPYALIPRVY